MRDLLINAFLFLYISFAVSFVWVGITRKESKVIIKETFKTFGIFVVFAIGLGMIVYFMS